MTDVVHTAGHGYPDSLILVNADQETIRGNGSQTDPLRATGGSFTGTDNGIGAHLSIGMPVYVTGAGNDQPARGNAAATSVVVGVLSSVPSFADPNAPLTVQPTGVLELTVAQWDGIVGGSGGLTPGAAYFVSSAAAGAMTTVAPSAGGTFATQVGIALTATKLLIQIGPAKAN